MLEEYLQRLDVIDFMKRLKTSECYFEKSNYGFLNHTLCVSSEFALYIFYDALLKFKIIVDDNDLFDEYFEQLQKLFRKFDDFENVRFGIHKLIAKMVASKYYISDLQGEGRKRVLSKIYHRYIVNGYYYHGFHSTYYSSIVENGFVPEYYDNLYDRFVKVNSIFNKYHLPAVFDKNFTSTDISFTDDALLGCYYSMYAPMFFTEFMNNTMIFGKKNRMTSYLEGNLSSFLFSLKRFMSLHSFQEKDRQFLIDLVMDEWNLLHSKNQELCLLMVPRRKLSTRDVSLNEYLEDDGDLFEVVDRLLSSKNNRIPSHQVISKEDIQIITLPNYYEEKEEKKLVNLPKEEYDFIREKSLLGGNLSNAYGRASVLVLAGSFSISLGVILSILTVLGG